MSELLQNPALMYAIAAAVVVLAFVLLVWALKPAKKEIVAFRGRYGHVTVSRAAIQSLIQRAAVSVDGVEKCDSRLSTRRGKLTVELKIEQLATAQLAKIDRALESQIGRMLKETLGIEELGTIDVTVSALVGDPLPPPEEPTEPETPVAPSPVATQPAPHAPEPRPESAEEETRAEDDKEEEASQRVKSERV